MEQLQLCDVAGYLPYGLQGITIDTFFGIRKERNVNININTAGIYLDEEHETYPLLLPLSCLIEEIEHKGKNIVPIVELAKLAGLNVDGCAVDGGDDWAKCSCPLANFYFIEGAFTMYDDDLGEDVSVVNVYLLFDFLHELHIDYRNLIGRGLAKDKRLFNNK